MTWRLSPLRRCFCLRCLQGRVGTTLHVPTEGERLGWATCVRVGRDLNPRPCNELTSVTKQSIQAIKCCCLNSIDLQLFCLIDDETNRPVYRLAGVVCFYGLHYSTFIFHSKLEKWISFDDATVTEVFTVKRPINARPVLIRRCLLNRCHPTRFGVNLLRNTRSLSVSTC